MNSFLPLPEQFECARIEICLFGVPAEQTHEGCIFTISNMPALQLHKFCWPVIFQQLRVIAAQEYEYSPIGSYSPVALILQQYLETLASEIEII